MVPLTPTLERSQATWRPSTSSRSTDLPSRRNGILTTSCAQQSISRIRSSRGSKSLSTPHSHPRLGICTTTLFLLVKFSLMVDLTIIVYMYTYFYSRIATRVYCKRLCFHGSKWMSSFRGRSNHLSSFRAKSGTLKAEYKHDKQLTLRLSWPLDRLV